MGQYNHLIMHASDFDIVADLPADVGNRAFQPKISRSSKISAHFSLSWRSDCATHIDSQYMDNLNFWRDFFPPEIEMQLDGASAGERIRHCCSTGEVVPGFSKAGVHTVKQQSFNRNFDSRIALEPRLGRFYPRGVFENIPGNYSSNYQPSRITAIEDDLITTDFNHPLATRALDIDARIISIWDGGQERGGRCNDIIDMLATNGPGMQARANGTATDFWSDDPFARDDPSADGAFYATPRLVDHLDPTCSQQIGELYKQLLPHHGHLLDLMSSRDSHLPGEFSSARITGLGMNPLELEQNPMLDESLVHDLNLNPLLPYADESFDGIACTASIEYLVSPRQVFSELARILRPGAPLVVTFSNRWFPPKAIRIWAACHDFERMGLVLEYFIGNGTFENLHSYSLRGLPRPENDRYADRLALSDPVYAVWGTKC